MRFAFGFRFFRNFCTIAAQRGVETDRVLRANSLKKAKLSAAKAREREAIATLRKADLARTRGELISRREAQNQAAFIFITLRQKLLAMPAAIARKLDVPDRHKAKLIIDSAVREVLTELAELPDAVMQKQYEDFVGNGGGPEAGKTSR